MASLALQLQMSTQSCHDEIGRIGAELQAIVPRCAADVRRVKSGLEGMELDVRSLLGGMMNMNNSKKNRNSTSSNAATPASAASVTSISTSKANSESNKSDKIRPNSPPHQKAMLSNNVVAENNAINDANTTASAVDDDPNPLSTLHSLLNLKNHLTTTRSILAAASSWDETINSIPKLLASSSQHHGGGQPNLIEAVAALSKLEQGARALKGMPEGQAERSAAIIKLRTQLEILLKPQLLHALKKMDTRLGPLQSCVSMYVTLGKVDVMREEYVKMRPGEVITLWFSFGGGNNSGSGNKRIVADYQNEKEDKEKDDDDDEEEEEDVEAEDFDFSEETAKAKVNAATTSTTAAATTTQINARQFVEFLPTFYEAVLELLSKERTQSKLVFGPELAPSIVGKVLLACFKPIISSFKNRLGNVCPIPLNSAMGSSNNNNSGGGALAGDGFGGTEGIAAAYKSTIQFLSLAYDQMEPWEGGGGQRRDDNNENIIGNDYSDELETIRTTFRLIASPFVPYQRALAEVERNPLGKVASMVAKDVRSVVSLQDAADRLRDLAPLMFPLADCKCTKEKNVFCRVCVVCVCACVIAALVSLFRCHAHSSLYCSSFAQLPFLVLSYLPADTTPPPHSRRLIA
jgi:hypothetical protein